MKLIPILLLAVLVTAGCSTMQTTNTAKAPDPETVARLEREKAEKQLHEGMLKLLAEADHPSIPATALASSAEFAANH